MEGKNDKFIKIVIGHITWDKDGTATIHKVDGIFNFPETEYEDFGEEYMEGFIGLYYMPEYHFGWICPDIYGGDIIWECPKTFSI